MSCCTNARCKIVELHEAHDEDFESKPRRYPSKTALAVAAGRPRVVRRVSTPDGPLAYVKCPECQGGGCGLCVETGRISLYRWHIWRNSCG